MNKQDQQFHHPSKSAGKKLVWMVAGISSLFCVLLIALLFAIGKEEPTAPKHVQSDDVIDLLESPTHKVAGTVDINSSEIGIELPKGGWVQQTDSMGNLIQQYRCESLDPNPTDLPGWIEMKKPEVELYLGDNRLIQITGDVGIANAPKRTLESGEIAGHVVVKMFEIDKMGNSTDPIPLMELQTVNAIFDNFLGEINCPNEVRITSPSQTLAGRNLAIRFNDLEERIEYVHLAELDYIEFIPNQKSTFAPQPSVPDTTFAPIKNSKHSVRASAANRDIEYFIVTLDNNVNIQQGDALSGRFASGSLLTITFSNETKKPTNASNAETNPMKSNYILPSIPVAIAATSLASVDLPLNEQPVRVTCKGGLTMVPLDDPLRIPSTPEETRIELFAFHDAPALLTDKSQNMTATGDLLRFELNQDRSDLFGAPATVLMNDMLTSSDHLWIARQNGLGGAEGHGSMISNNETAETSLHWSEGVDFLFSTSQDGGQGALQEVACHGDVILSDQGNSVLCETLTVSFIQTGSGSSSPSIALATGNVKAVSESQTMWANQAEVLFTNEKDSNGTEEESIFGGSRADVMQASGDVQVLLDDGGRVFCDELEGNISQDSASLKGNVVIAYERMLMNRGERASLTLDRASGKGKWSGPGQALFLETPLDVSPDRRIDRPVIQNESPNEISMRSNWHKEMAIDQQFNDGAGAIDLVGNVDVRSQRTALERSKMTGEDLRLEFILESNEASDSKRLLKKVMARDHAQLEHRTWQIESPDSPPVVYYIGGNHLEFDIQTQNALAVGEGELVLRDPRTPTNEIHQSALAGRGTTRFTWENKLLTTQLKGNNYRLELTGNVEMVHKGLDGSIGMLTSDKIEAIAVDPQSVHSIDGNRSELTLRGMDLQTLQATGSVYVATETRRVDCDTFLYNLNTGIAKLSASDNRSVAIVTEGTPYPVRATSVVWNMDPAVDSITIRGLQGISSN